MARPSSGYCSAGSASINSCSTCSSGTYDHDSDHNTSCQNCTSSCNNGYTLTGTCNATTTPTCVECSSGTYDDDNDHTTACVSCTSSCGNGFTLTGSCTSTSDKSCTPCGSGTGTTTTATPPPVWHVPHPVVKVSRLREPVTPRRTNNVPRAAVANGTTMVLTARRVKVGHKPVVPPVTPLRRRLLCVR